MKFPVVFGSTREGRLGLRLAKYICNKLEAIGHQAILIDPVEYPLPLLERTYASYKGVGIPDVLERLKGHFTDHDGVICVVAEYNHGPPPALINLLYHFLEEYYWRPSGIVTYTTGSFGGVRASVPMRPILADLGMPAIPMSFAVPRIYEAFNEAGEPQDPRSDQRVGKFLAEFEWYADALRTKRLQGVPF